MTIGTGFNDGGRWHNAPLTFDRRYGDAEMIGTIGLNNYGPIDRLDGKPEQVTHNLVMNYSLTGPSVNYSTLEITDGGYLNTVSNDILLSIAEKGCTVIVDDWMGVEYHFQMENPIGSHNGMLEAWIYNSSGEHLKTFRASGIAFRRDAISWPNDKFNRFFFGGNNAAYFSWGPTMEAPYYVDDLIIHDNRIGPTYFALLNETSTSPARSNAFPSGALQSGTSHTSISLTTNEAATCKYSLTAGTDYGLMTNGFISTGGTTHSTNVSGLSDGQSYIYYVKCQDSSNNTNTDDFEISFSVANAGTDITPPTRDNRSPAGELNAGTTAQDISLSTNEDATCKYSEAAGTSYANMTNFTETLGTNHTTQVTGLENGSTYNYYVKCKDSSENINSDDYAITFSVANAQVVNNSTTSKGSGKCFIATAAYGTPLAGEVKILSRFRDNHLLTNYCGKIFVNLYYKYSPKIAECISQKLWLKRVIRLMLSPLVNLIR